VGLHISVNMWLKVMKVHKLLVKFRKFTFIYVICQMIISLLLRCIAFFIFLFQNYERPVITIGLPYHIAAIEMIAKLM